MPFCYSPWTNIDINPSGAMTPCCKFQVQTTDQTFNIRRNSFNDYTNSEFLANIKQDFLKEQWPVGCVRCQTEEENNIKSKRQLDYERWEPHYQQVDLSITKFLTASIAFGNTCNLKCITCNPNVSSRWQKEHEDLTGISVLPFHFYKKDFVNDFIDNTPGIVHFDIPGGEPFLGGVTEQKQLLSYYISSNLAQNITLHYTTNTTIFPDNEWWELWKHFKEVDIQLSIDGVGSRQEYIRFPSEWTTVLKNTQQYITNQQTKQNIKLSVSHTLSAYNIYYLDEFFTWCYNIGLPRPWIGKVHKPEHMRPTVWPTVPKTMIIEQLNTSQHPEVQLWAKLLAATDDSDKFETFKLKLKQHDNYRRLSFSDTFPELSSYI